MSFIEGRIPPFISPIYSPCGARQVVNITVGGGGTAHGWTPSFTLLTGTKACADPRLKESMTQRHHPFCEEETSPHNRGLVRFKGCITEWECDPTYIHARSCPFLPFHSGRDAAQVSSRDASGGLSVCPPPRGKPRLCDVVMETGTHIHRDGQSCNKDINSKVYKGEG